MILLILLTFVKLIYSLLKRNWGGGGFALAFPLSTPAILVESFSAFSAETQDLPLLGGDVLVDAADVNTGIRLVRLGLRGWRWRSLAALGNQDSSQDTDSGGANPDLCAGGDAMALGLGLESGGIRAGEQLLAGAVRAGDRKPCCASKAPVVAPAN